MNELINDLNTGNISNSYALVGSVGAVYKTVLDFCLKMFCDVGNSCGRCSSCKKIINEEYVDFHIIRKNSKNVITVVDANYIISQAVQKSFEGKNKVFFIEEADNMNEAAQNKLLKIIEEPPHDTIFIFGVNKISNLLLTIKSRCSVLHTDNYSVELLVKKLAADINISLYGADVLVKAADGDCNIALQLHEENYLSIRDNIIKIIEKVLFPKNYAFSSVIETIEQYSKKHDFVFLAFHLILYDLLSVKIKSSIIYNSDKYDYFDDICSKLRVPVLIRLLKIVDNFHLRLQQSSGINMHLLYESMILSMLSVTLNNKKSR